MKIFVLLSICIFSLASCGSIKSSLSDDKGLQKTDNFIGKKDSYIVPLRPYEYKIMPGDVVRVEVKISEIDINARLICNEKEIPFFVEKGKIVAYVSESYFSDMGKFKCIYGRPLANFDVVEKKFPKERLYVDKKRVVLSKKDQERVIREQKMLNKIYAMSPSTPIFVEGFKIPLKSKVTSIYGIKRIFNNSKKTQHLGTDYRARIGVKVKSTNSGKVVFAGNLFYTGKTVILDHGMGIFTVYGHLSKLLVSVKEFVGKNTVIARSGNTGRSTGPHLHWGVKVNGNWVNGNSLVEQTEILNTL